MCTLQRDVVWNSQYVLSQGSQMDKPGWWSHGGASCLKTSDFNWVRSLRQLRASCRACKVVYILWVVDTSLTEISCTGFGLGAMASLYPTHFRGDPIRPLTNIHLSSFGCYMGWCAQGKISLQIRSTDWMYWHDVAHLENQKYLSISKFCKSEIQGDRMNRYYLKHIPSIFRWSSS